MNVRNTFLSIVTLLAVVGTLNASYLTYTAFMGIAPECTLLSGCDLVSASPYSRVFGIPLALFGVFFYISIFGFSLWGLFQKTVQVRMFLVLLTTLGFVLSLYFLYLQAVVIGAFCQYCLLSLFDATILFVTSLLFARRERKNASEEKVPFVVE